MNNLFGKSLRSQMEKAGVKESELAGALSYDTTYISKWINGSKLPSARNVDRIIGQIADFFVERTQYTKDADQESQRQSRYAELKKAYDSDSSYVAFQNYNNNELSFLNDSHTLFRLTREALMQAMTLRDRCVCIMATFDIFHLYGKDFKRLMQELQDAGVKKVELKLVLNPDVLKEKYYSYAATILNTIGYFDFIEMSIVRQKPEQPHIMVINDLFCLQVLWNLGGELAAVFSMDPRIIRMFSNMCCSVLESSDKLLDPADPESLKRTNVQLDSYADRRQWLFFNEPPAMLFPDELMDSFIEQAEREEYASYLIKLKNIFTKHTCKSRIDLILYSSMLNKYLTDGKISLGNVRQHLTEEQTRKHIRYLSDVMKENTGFKVYLIRDTVVFSEELRGAPSVFLDTYSLNIENSKDNPNDNYHISMDPVMRDAFEGFFEKVISRSYCTELTAEDLLRYL